MEWSYPRFYSDFELSRKNEKFDKKEQRFLKRKGLQDYEKEREFLRVLLFRKTPIKTENFPTPGFKLYEITVILSLGCFQYVECKVTNVLNWCISTSLPGI